jgi:glutathione reductase (NADPH)
MAFDFDLFVIGGGSAGVRCARIAASYGARVGVAEERYWGGTCVNVGCVPKKIMVQASEYDGYAADARGFGWDITVGGHDWPALMAAKDREVGRLNAVYHRLLDGVGAQAFDARAVFLDPNTLDVGGRRVTAERIVVATGGKPSRPPIAGVEHGAVSDDMFHLPALPRRVAILGSGYIAVEFAGIFAGLGAEVELIYRQPLPLKGFDLDLRECLAEALTNAGIRLHPDSMPERIALEGEVRVVHLGQGLAVEADLLLLATGRLPNVNGLSLDRAGVATTNLGAVIIDADLRTSQPHIYAIGDVTDRVNLTPVATAEGHALADTLFGGRPRRISMQNIPTAVFTTPPIATIGLSEAEAVQRGPVDVYVTRFTPLRHTISGRARRTMMKLVVDQASQVVLGVHMLGEDAPEIMQGLAIAITCGATKADFDRTIGIHPTAAEEFVTLRTRTRVAGIAEAAQ